MATYDKQVLRADLGNLAATDAAVRYIRNDFDHAVEVETLAFTPAIAVTAHATNIRNFNASVGGTGLITEIGTTTGGTNSLVAGTPYEFTLLDTQAARTARRIAAGGTLLVSATHAASGVAIAGQWSARVRPVR